MPHLRAGTGWDLEARSRHPARWRGSGTLTAEPSHGLWPSGPSQSQSQPSLPSLWRLGLQLCPLSQLSFRRLTSRAYGPVLVPGRGDASGPH